MTVVDYPEQLLFETLEKYYFTEEEIPHSLQL